mmetsp:Transcript_16701/g.29138  ORF Transcript_16701/g.29138 Transcript_16701/m.29138 type:complete len:411 (+) Transcript_16701:156-1388(+)
MCSTTATDMASSEPIIQRKVEDPAGTSVSTNNGGIDAKKKGALVATGSRLSNVSEDNNSGKDVEMASLLNTDGTEDDSESPSSSPVNSSGGGWEWAVRNTKKNANVLSACSFYSFCSVSMVLVNKSLASSYNHLIEGDLNILLVVFQAIVAVVCVDFCKRLGLVEYPNFNLDTAKQWAPVNLFFCAMLFTGMASLQFNSVPMVTVFKNVANITTAIGDFYFFGNKSEPLVMVAFGIMLSGAIAAAWNDIEIRLAGIFWMALNCLSTSGYVLYMKFATKNVKLSKFGMVFYNNVLCVAFLLPAATAMGQTQIFLSTPTIHTPDYAFKNIFAGMVGFLLNFAALHCVSVTGPTTYAIIGSLNKIPVAFLGYILFDNIITNETWFFIAVSMAGGFLYSYAKLRSSGQRVSHTK